jgi:homospermidine synthase
MVMIGFGSIGQGVLPLIFRHIDIKPEQITVISAEDRGGLKEMKRFGVDFIKKRLTARTAPDPRQAARQGRLPGQPLGRGRLDRAGRALPGEGALYIDTCIEPWPGGYTDPSLSVSLRSNYALRETMLALKPKYRAGRRR